MSDAIVRRPTLVDLFAGAGGMSLGFKRAGFDPIYAVEWEKDAAATYAANFGHHGHAGDPDIQEFPEADVMIGGRPARDLVRSAVIATTTVGTS